MMLNYIRDIDKNPIVIKYAQTAVGKLTLILIYVIFMHNIQVYPDNWQLMIILVITAISFLPQYRHLFIFAGMLSLLFQNVLIQMQPDWELLRINYLYSDFRDHTIAYTHPTRVKNIDILMMLLVSELIIFATGRFKSYKIMQYPIAISYLFVLSLIGVAGFLISSPLYYYTLWSFILVYIHYFWFIAYTILEKKLSKQRDYLLDYGRYLPIWGYTALPYGKGSIYLSKVESLNPADFAVTQLKAVKLVFWAFLLNYLWTLMTYGQTYFNIPSLDKALSDYANGQHYPIYQAWLCMINRFFQMMIGLTVTGHVGVSTCRIIGFRILRNTYKPLQSVTVAEFWGRYNYYFKELMAEFFYYPAYFRYFKNMPRLRIFFAAISAAAFGNILFHYLLTAPTIMTIGLTNALYGFIPFALYACILGISIGISQLRNKSQTKPDRGLLRHSLYSIPVLIFYAMLGLFNQPYQNVSVIYNLKLLSSLFNLTW